MGHPAAGGGAGAGRRAATNLFDSDLGVDRIRRFADPANWPAAFAEVTAGLEQERIGDGPLGAERRAIRLGAGGARERIWLQCDWAHEPAAAALAAWALVESLVSTRVSRYRHPVLTRASVVVVTPSAAPPAPPRSQVCPPLFDAGTLGASPAILTVMDRFAPTVVVHLQDWAQNVSLAEDPTGAGSSRLAGVGLRMVESFHLEPDLHARIGEHPPGRNRLGRPTAEARALAAHPEARVGLLARRYVGQMGFRLFDRAAEARASGDPSAGMAVRLAPGRYACRLEWRRLSGVSFAELAHHRYGALAICGQTFGHRPEERAGASLALAEGVTVYGLGLDVLEPAA